MPFTTTAKTNLQNCWVWWMESSDTTWYYAYYKVTYNNIEVQIVSFCTYRWKYDIYIYNSFTNIYICTYTYTYTCRACSWNISEVPNGNHNFQLSTPNQMGYQKPPQEKKSLSQPPRIGRCLPRPVVALRDRACKTGPVVRCSAFRYVPRVKTPGKLGMVITPLIGI